MADKKGTGRSKFASCPGSITAIRVHYSRNTNAFDPPEAEGCVAKRKDELARWKNPHRLGLKAQWNTATESPWQQFPERPAMRTLQAYQATRIEHDFRAQKIPTVYKDSVFVPKHSKFQPDPKSFLSEEDRRKLIPRNVGGTLTRFESPEDTSGWDPSVTLEKSLVNVHYKKPVQPSSYGLINKARRPVNGLTYKSPQARVHETNAAMRQEKIRQREEQRRREEEASVAPYTLSNKHTQVSRFPDISMFAPGVGGSASARNTGEADEAGLDGAGGAPRARTPSKVLASAAASDDDDDNDSNE
ncbi:hypothetical protein DIPPA_22515 [Diplonema papillatum]|nr:hypothetical protein DIPPA_22515 [Diplonema papillatum]